MSNDSAPPESDPDLLVQLIRFEINLIYAYVQAAVQAESRGDWDRATEALSHGASRHSRIRQLLVQVPEKDKAALVASLQAVGALLA